MLKKCTILGLVLLLAGGAAFGWLYREMQAERLGPQDLLPASSLGLQGYVEKYGRWYQLSPEQQNQLVLEIDKERKSKTADQLAREQQARLHADLDKLAAGQMSPGDIADFLYGRGWEDQVKQYKERNEQRETAQTVAIVCLSIGGVLFGICFVVWLFWLAVWTVRAVRHRSAEPEPEPEPQPEPKAAELTTIELQDLEPEKGPEPPAPEPPKRRKVLARSETPAETSSGQPAALEDLFNPLPTQKPAVSGSFSAVQPTGEDSGVAVLLADEQAPQGEWSPQSQWSLQGTSQTAAWPSNRESGSTEAHPLKEQAEDLQKQIAEFKQVAQNVQQATQQQSAPLNNTLKELAQQVSAIREYAASQQDRVEKLQDGYDWGIIRTFCLRVIRCIDNLEGRLAELPKNDGAIAHLEEVKDELIFALESSGVEQFRPDLNSEFRGQEKIAEALKEKQPAKKPEQAGKVAQVIRPGYRYVIDDENYRVVRTAQVKLYG